MTTKKIIKQEFHMARLVYQGFERIIVQARLKPGDLWITIAGPADAKTILDYLVAKGTERGEVLDALTDLKSIGASSRWISVSLSRSKVIPIIKEQS